MKESTQQNLLAAVGFTIWALFAVAGVAMPAQAHEYTYQCPGSGGVLVTHPSQCNTPTVPDVSASASASASATDSTKSD